MRTWLKALPAVAFAGIVAAACGGSASQTAREAGGSPDSSGTETGSPDVALTCPGTQTLCGQTCTNTATDNANCGSCGNACAAGKVCQRGQCSLTCGALTTCTSEGGAAYCANTQTDNANCGACATSCASGTVCAGGQCTSSCGSLTTCTLDGGAPYCANTRTDNANCGACGTGCASGTVCASGQCGLTCGTLTTCTPDGGAPYCANTQTDNANCGACGTPCASGSVCAGGHCALTCGTLTTCTPDGGAPYCANTQTDNANCGACGTPCASGTVCASGQCALTCGTLTTCTPHAGAPYCANTQTDNANCGACGTPCGSGTVCASGQCTLTCGALTTCAPNGGAPYCANTQTDNANCGACGTPCGSGTVCASGQCTLTCGTLTSCAPDGGTPYCANTETDNANCGACGAPCPTGQSCSSGTCAPPPGSTAGCADAEDPYWGNVIAYLPCQGPGIADASGHGTIALHNSPTIAATPAGAPGGSSCNLGHTGSYATANGFTVSALAPLGAGDYTLEISIYQTAWNDPSDQNANILLPRNAYPPSPGNFPALFSHNSVQHVQFVPGFTPGGGTAVYTDTTSALNTWESYAASRVAGTVYLFRDGALLTSFADPTNYTGTGFFIGYQQNGAYNAMMGAVTQIRVTNAGRYTSPYTPCSGGFATDANPRPAEERRAPSGLTSPSSTSRTLVRDAWEVATSAPWPAHDPCGSHRREPAGQGASG